MFAPKSTHKKGKKSAEPEEEPQGIAQIIDKISKYADKMGVIMSVMSPEYEGGDFCSGLTAAFEVKTIAMDVAADLVKNMFNKGHDADYLQ